MQPCSLVFLLPVAALELQRQSWATETSGQHSLTYLPFGLWSSRCLIHRNGLHWPHPAPRSQLLPRNRSIFRKRNLASWRGGTDKSRHLSVAVRLTDLHGIFFQNILVVQQLDFYLHFSFYMILIRESFEITRVLFLKFPHLTRCDRITGCHLNWF